MLFIPSKRRALPGSVLLHSMLFATGRYSPSAMQTRLAGLGVQEGCQVLMYLGSSDLDHLSYQVMRTSFNDAFTKRGAAYCADVFARNLLPFCALIEDMGATPVLFACLCYDDFKVLLSHRLSIAYYRSDNCGGIQFDLVYTPTP